MNKVKKIVFLSGTRADYGKIKSLISALKSRNGFDVHVFATGMHLLEKYGTTALEVIRDHEAVYLFNNQAFSSKMDLVVSNTITGFSSYIDEIHPDMIVVHGDRPEALSGAIVGCLNNIIVAHIEGGEVSGAVDEIVRHAVTKLSHLHFVSNQKAEQRLVRMGEYQSHIAVVGSLDIDVMLSDQLPSLRAARERYDISFNEYAIAILHPVTTDKVNVNEYIDALLISGKNYIVIDPNNDPGSEEIRQALDGLNNNPSFRRFPSIRFEYFLTMLKHANFVIGNSSLGVREAPVYGVQTVNIGSRQRGRSQAETILNVNCSCDEIVDAISRSIHGQTKYIANEFGDGLSTDRIVKFLERESTWNVSIQKYFGDYDS